jgi:hypothetical protein
MALDRLDLDVTGGAGLPASELTELVAAKDPERDLMDEEVAHAIENAREAGVSWSAIADALRSPNLDKTA